MRKRIIGTGAAVLLAAGGWVAATKWDGHRMAACEQRGSRFSALGLLDRRPDGFRPGSPATAAGCDVDRVVAYADKQFVAVGGPTGDAVSGQATPARVDRAAVTAFYRQVLVDDAWHVASGAAADLCASKDLPFGTAYVNLSFSVAGQYDVMVADTPASDADCT